MPRKPTCGTWWSNMATGENDNRPICRFFLTQEGCRFGAACCNRHERTSQPCRYYFSSGCWNGSRCPYSHVSNSREASPAKISQKSDKAETPKKDNSTVAEDLWTGESLAKELRTIYSGGVKDGETYVYKMWKSLLNNWFSQRDCQVYIVTPFLDYERLNDITQMALKYKNYGTLSKLYTRVKCDESEGNKFHHLEQQIKRSLSGRDLTTVEEVLFRKCHLFGQRFHAKFIGMVKGDDAAVFLTSANYHGNHFSCSNLETVIYSKLSARDFDKLYLSPLMEGPQEEEAAGPGNKKKRYDCGICGMQFKDIPDPKEKLVQHYVDKMLNENSHIHYFKENTSLFQGDANCNLCMRWFQDVRALVQHVCSKIKANREDKQGHKDMLCTIINYVIDWTAAECDEERSTTKKALKKFLKTELFSGSDEDEDEDCEIDVPLLHYMQRTLARHMLANGKLDTEALEKETEERTENCGFLRDEVEELLCQGVKPWDDEAYAVLDVLYDF